MKEVILALVLGLGISAFGWPSARQSNDSNVPTRAGALRVNSPKANEQIGQKFVHVTFQLTNAGTSPASSPNFTVQLDGNDSVTTGATDYTFTGLTPGAHNVTVTLVDANGMPMANSSVSTMFTVSDGKHTDGALASSYTPVHTIEAASAASDFPSLSDSSTPLPMLSLVGFGILVGGICTAVRNR